MSNKKQNHTIKNHVERNAMYTRGQSYEEIEWNHRTLHSCPLHAPPTVLRQPYGFMPNAFANNFVPIYQQSPGKHINHLLRLLSVLYSERVLVRSVENEFSLLRVEILIRD